MKQKHTSFKSNKARPRLSSLSDLITNSENTMLSSQATVTSQQSQKYRFTQSQSQQYWNDLESYEDILTEEADTLRITPEEQRRIQSILELARKGKINPGNAFEIPVRVVDPQLGEGQNMRFWKFASELLSASMGIYDKRVQHVYLGTNRMFDSLLRVASNKTESQDPDQKNRRQRGMLIKMEVGEIGENEAMASYDFGNVNCEQPVKLNIKKSLMQFSTDPLFNKRLQAFDSDSLKSLFLNVFETGNSLQVVFFHQKEHSQVDPPIEGQNVSLPMFTSVSDEQSTQTNQEVFQMPYIRVEQLKKLNFIANNKPLFQNFGIFRKQNQREGFLQGVNLIGDFHEQLNMSGHFNIQRPDDVPESTVNQEQFNYEAANDFTQYSENLNNPTYDSDSITEWHHSQNPGSRYLLSPSQNYDYNSEMTPWDLEFKGMKLQKRKQAKRGKREVKKDKPKLELLEDEIDFLDGNKQKRALIFKAKPEGKVPASQKITDRCLIPMNIDPFKRAFSYGFVAGVNEAKSKQNEKFLQSQYKNDNISQNFQIELDNDNPEQQTRQEAIDEIPFVGSSSQPFAGFQSQRSSNTTLKNIRQVKQRLFQRLMEAGEIRLSDIDIGLSPSSIMVVVLHLANQMKLQILSSDDDSDILLRGLC